MPYKTISELPDNVDGLPKHAKEIYMKAFNAAYKTYNGEEHKAHAVAWTAVERSYKKENGKWVAKTKESIIPNKLSDENKRQLLQQGLTTEYGLDVDNTVPRGVWVEDVFESEVIYNVNGQSYKISYKLNEDGEVAFGDPEKVMRQTVYKPMESLQSTYSEIIQEAGRRNANLDSTRIKKIVEICQELLSSEGEPDEDKLKKAVKEATSVLTLIREQAPVKTEDGERFPAAAFAYVPDSEKPSGWKLRLWEDTDKKVTRAQLGRAAAALSPGGFRGQKVAIPSLGLSAIKRVIRTEYRKLDVEEEAIPRWVKETMVRDKARFFTPLTEATFDRGVATIIVIKPGFNADKSRYYPIEMLKRDYKVFEGQKMYADHPTEEEDKALPERSVKEGGWISTLTNVTCDENGVVSGTANIIEDWMMRKLANLRDKKMLSEMGISINAVGSASEATIDGVETLLVEELTGCRSVDFVTEPGAGGGVTFYESDRSRDLDLVELSGLKEMRPDLVKSIEAVVRAEIQQEVKHKMELEQKVIELEGQNETLTTENTGLKDKITEAEKEKAKAEAQATIKEAVDKATLPEAAKERLIERFAEAESADGIAEAIQSEIDYIAKLAESGKVKNLGPTNTPTEEKDVEALRESYKLSHPEWSEAQVEMAIKGR